MHYRVDIILNKATNKLSKGLKIDMVFKLNSTFIYVLKSL